MDINEIQTHAYALFRMLGEAKTMEYLKRQVEDKTITEDQVEEMIKNWQKGSSTARFISENVR